MLIDVFVLCASEGPRLNYVLKLIFGEHLGLNVKIIHSLQEYNHAEGILLNYSNDAVEQAHIVVPESGFLRNQDQLGCRPPSFDFPRPEDNGFGAWKQIGGRSFHLAFDLFSQVFYLISRYEEFFPVDRDQYGRYPASSSAAFQYGFLRRPLIDEWISSLQEIICTVADCNGLKKSPQMAPSIDVDIPYAYVGKPIKRIAAGVKDLLTGNISHFKSRLSHALEGVDPFDTYDYLFENLNEYSSHTIFFFLMRNQGRYDENHLLNTALFRNLLRRTAMRYRIGLHPSFTSQNNYLEVEQEKRSLEDILGLPVISSRQHYLRLHLPHTYRILSRVGIKEDYSMQYPEKLGFRASTSKPFFWYDLAREIETDLKIYPGCFMDVTARYYENLDIEAALEIAEDFKASIQKVGGEFRWIWHNSSFSKIHGWNSWKPLFEDLLRW